MKKIETLVIATKNKHKADEIRSMLSELPIKLTDLSVYSQCPDVEEDEETLEGNAIKKARTVHEYTKVPTIADDSGLEVYYLLGEPGVMSARYAGKQANYDDNNRLLLLRMRQVPDRKRHARFRTVIAFVGAGATKTVEGICEGKIVFAPRGAIGFGYDPLFQPLGYDLTFAEMSAEMKNSISHRAKAIAKLKNLLQKLI